MCTGNDTRTELSKRLYNRDFGAGGGPVFHRYKWSFLAGAKGDHKYLVCNADEGDPGAFMDRSILEGDPHSVIEGMIIAAYATGADFGYIYCRAEYPLAIRRLNMAIRQAKNHNYFGDNILGSGFRLSLESKGRRGCLCLRRGDRPDGEYRGETGNAPAASPLSRTVRY